MNGVEEWIRIGWWGVWIGWMDGMVGIDRYIHNGQQWPGYGLRLECGGRNDISYNHHHTIIIFIIV